MYKKYYIDYDNYKTGINKTGTFYASKYQTAPVSAFSNSNRPSPAKLNESPGPGT